MPEHRARDAASVDLGLAWTWEFDAPFIRAIAAKFQERGLSVQEITPANISSVTEDVLSRRRRLRAIFDRASDEDDSFHELADFMLREHRAAPGTPGRFLNPPDDSRRAADKATMHLEFISNGIHVPYTIILSPLSEEPVVSIQADRLENLGKPFVIKPANTTGGGIGVVLNARTIEEVMAQRKVHRGDKYLLQRRVVPVYLSESRAWFRVFFAFGDVRLCWWDDQTHVYEEVTGDEERWFGLDELRTSAKTIANVCGLDFFSTEFAQTGDGTFVSVDYVNELCDMRPKSIVPTGVPDSLLHWVATRMMLHLAQ